MAEVKAESKGAAKTKEQALAAFRDFDTDKSGSIDKKELQDLAFSLGEAMSEEALEDAFKALDADGSGTIDFDEFYTWFSSSDRGGSKASTLLKLKLRQRYLTREAKKMKGAITAAARRVKPTKPGHNRFHVRLSAGEVPAEAPLGAFVNLTHNKGSAFKELGAPDGCESVLFITLTCREGVADDDVEAAVNTLNETFDRLKEMGGFEGAPFFGITCEGPLLVPDGKDKIAMIKFWLQVDPFGDSVKALNAKVSDDASSVDSSDEDGQGGGGGGGGGAVLGANTADVIKYAGAALNVGQTMSQLLNGRSDGEIDMSLELCVDYDRTSLAVAAAGVRELAKAEVRKVLSEEVDGDLDALGDPDMDYTDMIDLSDYDYEKAKSLLRVASALDQIRAVFEFKTHLQYDSLSKQLKTMKLMGDDDGPLPASLIKLLLNPRHMRRQVKKVAGKMAEAFEDDDSPVKGLDKQFSNTFSAVDRIAFQSFDAMLSVDFTGFSLLPFFDILEKATQFDDEASPEVIMFGPKHSGKTRIVNFLRGGKTDFQAPFADGVRSEEVHLEAVDVKIHEVAGGEEYEDSISGYADSDTAGIVLVVDGQEKHSDKLDAAAALLHDRLAGSDFERKQPLLVYINKCDLQETMSVAAVTEALKLKTLAPARPFFVQLCSAATGVGITEGVEWLEANLTKPEED